MYNSPVPAIAIIKDIVATRYRMHPNQLMLHVRNAKIVEARMVCTYLCCNLTAMGVREIADYFGQTHSNISHAKRAIQNRLDVDMMLSNDIARLIEKCNQALTSARQSIDYRAG